MMEVGDDVIGPVRLRPERRSGDHGIMPVLVPASGTSPIPAIP